MSLTVEDITENVGSPAVGLTFTATGQCTVTCTTGGVSRVVRTARALDVTDSEYVEDVEAPVGVALTYTLTVDGQADSKASITLESAYAWLSDPLDHTNIMRLGVTLRHQLDGLPTLLAGSGGTGTRSIRGTLTTPVGGDSPILLGAGRQAPVSVPLGVRTPHDRVQDMRQLVEQAPVLLLRTPDSLAGLPSAMYLVGDVLSTVTRAPRWVDWTMDATIVTPPGLPVVIVRTTWADVTTAMAGKTWAEVTALHSGTFLDAKRNPYGD